MTPLEQVRADVLSCNWEPVQYVLFSGEVDTLVYYSHLFPAIAALVLAFIVLKSGRRNLLNVLFGLIAILFAVFALLDQLLWAIADPSKIMFYWSLLTYIEPLIYALVLYLVIVFTYKRDTFLREKLFAGALLLPVLILGPTNLNLSGFDYTNCWRLAVEGPLLYYVYFIEIIFVGWIIVAATRAYRKTKDINHRKSTIYITIGSLLFLLAFSSGNIFGTLLQDVMGEDAWLIGQYGLFGMPIFLAFILYLIVRFNAFNTRLLGAEALTISLWVSLLALLFLNDLTTARFVIGATLVLFGILGYQLIHGIKRDIRQKQEIEKLADDLKRANKRLKELDQIKSEFVSIASHQLRSPLTSIRGYTSMLLEGSYGTLPKKATEILERINDSSRFMTLTVEDFLNVSRIESGKMKYEYSEFNIKELAKSVVDDMRQAALQKGLLLTFRSSDCDSGCMVHADNGKMRQVLYNLIDNAMKYTPEGSVTVVVKDDMKRERVYISICDTGVGMDKETMDAIFEKFVRSKNANQINVTGAGLGLYVAKQMIEKMGGSITPSSEGEGKGSTFTIELPLVE